jgi:lysophospholipase L1-like esterase
MSRWWIRRFSRYHVWEPGLRLELHQVPEVFPQVEPRARFEVNSDGERGREVWADDTGLYRVLVAGGSPVECFALDQPTSWPAGLERLLSMKTSRRVLDAPRVHVGSIGRGGITAQALDLIFERVLPQYRRLQAIVIMVGGNDVFHWLEDGAPESVGSVLDAAHAFARHPEQRFGWRPARWAILEVARRLRCAWLRPVEVREGAGSWVPAARRMRAQAKEIRTSAPDPGPMLDHFARHFRRLLERAQAHAERVIVVRQPWFEKEYTVEEAACCWHGGLGKPWKQTVSVYYTLQVVNQLMGLMDARAAAVASDLGIEDVDLRDTLAPTLENYYDYVHYTPAGAAVVARAVAAALLRQPALVRQPYVSTRAEPASRALAAG